MQGITVLLGKIIDSSHCSLLACFICISEKDQIGKFLRKCRIGVTEFGIIAFWLNILGVYLNERTS
jgi:hypothetical protein